MLIGGKLIMWSHVYARGLKYVYQLFQNGCLKSNQQVRQFEC